MGLLASWVDRKLTARVQYRVGPPLLQPLNDILKLLGKETLIPIGAAQLTFLAAPILGLVSVIVVSTILWLNTLHPQQTFIGDLIVVLYLLLVPSISIILGGFASGNPLASLGASREIKLILSYELPFILVMLVPVIQADFSIRLGDIVAAQARNGIVAGSWSGALALIIAVLCTQAKLALVPFDMPEAETEIAHGVLIEYSGAALAIYRLMKHMLFFALPFLLVIVYLGGVSGDGLQPVYGLLKYLGLVIVLTLIRNTNPRLRIDQVMRLFWGPMTLLAVIAILLALGNY
jgi:NADH-quinone oxidoreductase subunit H